MWNSSEMMRPCVIFCLLTISFCGIYAEENTSGEQDEVPNTDPADGGEQVKAAIEASENQIEKAIEAIEQAVEAARDEAQEDSVEEAFEKKISEKLVLPMNHMMELLKDPGNVYKFIEAKGIGRVIYPHLHIEHEDLRSQLLTMTQLLFNVAPTTTSVIIPIAVMDKLLDIFELDDNVAFKSQTLSILSSWLPDNPKVQDRVMKKMGLEPFYHHMQNLDANSVNVMMRLLSKIIKEHIRVRNSNEHQKSKNHQLKLWIYKKIGLIEMLSTTRVCHGLFKVFKSIWEKAGDNHWFLHPVFEIISDVRPYCTDELRGRTGSVVMLQAMHKHMDEVGPTVKDIYERLGLNTTDFKLVLEEYLEKLSPNYKDEF